MKKRPRVVGAGAVLLAAALAGGAYWATTSRPSAGGGSQAGPVSPEVAVSQRVGELAADQPLTVHVLLPVNGDLPRAERFLRDAGLAVTDLPLVGLVTATGPARAVESAFGVRLYRWHNPATGKSFFANDSPAKLPFAVDGVFGLDDAIRLRPLDICPGSFYFLSVPWTFCGSGLKAAQVRMAYNVQKPLTDKGTKGDGQTVAIYALSGFSRQWIDDFDAHNDLTAPTIIETRVIKGSHPTTTLTPGPGLAPTGDGAEFEVEMDIEAVHAIAENAVIHVYEMDPASYVDFLVAVAYFHEHIASNSAGTCQSDFEPPAQHGELLLPTAASQYAELTRRLVEQEHISVFAASGDTGRICWSDANKRFEIGVNYPASDPSVTAVGGTNLELNSDDTLKAEQAWDRHDVLWHDVLWPTSGGQPQASGGGPAPVPTSYTLALPRVMTSFPRPDWQAGAGVPDGTGVPGEPQRLVPDVSAMSSPGLTIAVNPQANLAVNPQARYAGKEWATGGGTSLAAPLWAGFAALYNQVAQTRGAPPLGFANPLLYRLAGQSDHPFFDVTTSQGKGEDLAGLAKPGWDFATGLGSFNASAIIEAGIALTRAPTGRAATPPRAYILTGDLSGRVAVVPLDLATNTLGTPIVVPDTTAASLSSSIAITPDGKTAYVAASRTSDHGTGIVVPINLTTSTPGTPIPIGSTPRAMAVAADGKTAYVTADNFQDLGTPFTSTIQSIDLTTNTPGTPLTLPNGKTGAIAITPDGKTAYVTAGGAATVVPVNLATNTSEAPISLFPVGMPGAIAITPDGRTAYVTTITQSGNNPTVVPINLASNTPGTPISLPNLEPNSLAITPDGKTAYVTYVSVNTVTGTAEYGVVPINLATNTLGTLIPVPSAQAIAIAPDGKTAYVTSAANNNGAVIPINLATNAPEPPIVIQGGSPFAIVIAPAPTPTGQSTSTPSATGTTGTTTCGGISIFDYVQGDRCTHIGGLLTADGVQLTVGALTPGTSDSGKPELCAPVKGINTTSDPKFLTVFGFNLESAGPGPGISVERSGTPVNLQVSIGGTLNDVGTLAAGGTGTGTVCFDAGIASGQQVLIIYSPAAQGRSIWVR